MHAIRYEGHQHCWVSCKLLCCAAVGMAGCKVDTAQVWSERLALVNVTTQQQQGHQGSNEVFKPAKGSLGRCIHPVLLLLPWPLTPTPLVNSSVSSCFSNIRWKSSLLQRCWCVIGCWSEPGMSCIQPYA